VQHAFPREPEKYENPKERKEYYIINKQKNNPTKSLFADTNHKEPNRHDEDSGNSWSPFVFYAPHEWSCPDHSVHTPECTHHVGMRA